MNKALQKWAERKQKTLKKWSKEYHKLCVKEGIKEEPIVSMSFDGDYVSNIHSMITNKEGEDEFVLNVKASFFRYGKWS